MKERNKEMFYLTTHSTHFNYGYIGVGYMVEDHSDSETKPAVTTRATLFSISSNISFICTIAQRE